MTISPLASTPSARIDTPTKSKCPLCGTDDVELFSHEQMYAPMGHSRQNLSIMTISTYKCRCGTAFTDTVRREVKKTE